MSRSFWRKRPNSSPPEAFCRRAVGRRRLDKERGTPVESCSLPIQPPARTAHKEETDMTRPITLILAALALAVAVPAAAQEGTLKKIRDSGAITIGHRDASIPFSYYDDRQQPVGYAVELCLRIVDAVKSELKMPRLDVKYQLVTSANRIPLMANGTIDLECGSTTNNIARQKEVAFAITHFLTANRIVSKKTANLKSVEDLKGKTMVSTSGTTNITQLTELNKNQNMGMNIIPAN